MTRVVVTGGSGKVGRACVKDLLEHGYQVFNVDTVPPASDNCPFVQADLTDFGQAFEVLSEVDDRLASIDALVHLAAIPAPGKNPNAVIFKVNTRQHLQRLRGGAAPQDSQRRVGVERDRARHAVRQRRRPTSRSTRNIPAVPRAPTRYPS